MTPLQWALLVVGAIAVVAIYVFSRRERAKPEARARSAPTAAPAAAPEMAPKSSNELGRDQMDMFLRSGEFDEFGVGKPRKRVAPGIPAQQAQDEGQAPEPAPAPQKPQVEERLVTLLIAEREGTAIFGPKIHSALMAQNLQFGDKKIYHRLENGRTVFSVASLIKPGFLDPAEQQGFSTPGLTLFMLLPGPVAAERAVADMLRTARALARQLNAEVFDAKRELLTPAAEQAMVTDTRLWAQRHGL